MRVAFDITETCSPEPTGCGHFTGHVVQAMLAANQREGWRDEYSLHYRASHGRAAGNAFHVPGREVTPLPGFGLFTAERADIIHGFATHAPRLGRALRAVTLFDVFSALEESAQWQHPRSRKRKISQYRQLARTCGLVLAISEATKRDFLAHFDCPAERVHVVHGGVSDAFVPEARSRRAGIRERYDLPESYFLYVGAPVARKNVPRLVEAFAGSASRQRCALVIAGSINGETERLIEQVKAMGLGREIRFTGYVPDEDLPGLYACAEAFLFPTFYEGFGMPILEAMACGVPVVLGDRGAAPEIAGGYGLAVNPYDTAALCEAIDRVTATTDEDRGRAAAHARSFTWEKCALKTRDAYRWALEHGSR